MGRVGRFCFGPGRLGGRALPVGEGLGGAAPGQMRRDELRGWWDGNSLPCAGFGLVCSGADRGGVWESAMDG